MHDDDESENKGANEVQATDISMKLRHRRESSSLRSMNDWRGRLDDRLPDDIGRFAPE